MSGDKIFSGPVNPHGIFLTIAGPMILVTASGNLLQVLMARLYFEFSGLSSGIERPLLSQ